MSMNVMPHQRRTRDRNTGIEWLFSVMMTTVGPDLLLRVLPPVFDRVFEVNLL